ncbi:MAG TPA: alpha-hydroxy acid oxidase [Candidatus Limnocylindrales bacterium]|nr:alpha-hydroxy acid oxidase [Candidatus Limnocylindrales bacterium]
MVAHLVADELSRICSVDEFEGLARERMPIEGYSFVAGWAGSGSTARANLDAFARWAFRPRVLSDVSRIDTSTTVLGRTIALPVLFAPTALHSFAHPDAELATARAAEALDTIMIVSTGSSLPIEEIARAVTSPWFQLYWFTDRGLTADLVTRAEASGCAAVCLTVDAPVPGWREGEMRLPPLPSPGIRAGNLPEIVDPPLQVDGSLTWRSLAWLGSITKLPLVLKGVMTAEDASLALEHGVDGIVVSNHGGRQLDYSMATLDALPEVVDAVAGRIDVLVDGGIRRGTDVLKALALGARAVLIGRPVLWGLGAGGTEGIIRMMELIGGELVSAMGHTGQTSASRIDSKIITRRVP